MLSCSMEGWGTALLPWMTRKGLYEDKMNEPQGKKSVIQTPGAKHF